MAVTSATFMSAVANLVPAITFIVGIFIGLERLEFGTAVGKAKVFGTIMGIGGAMLFTFYKGFPIQPLKSDINLLPGTSTGHVALLASDHRVLGACLALASCFSYAIWIILQYRLDELNGLLPINYLCIVRGEGLVTMEAWVGHFFFFFLKGLQTSLVGTALVVRLITVSSRLRGPLFAAIFNPLLLVIVALHNEMKKRIHEVVPSNENEAQKSVEIIVVSGSNRISSIEMKMTENGTISERKDGVCVDREERTLADPR
uniref:WAT1-related protein n=1 Tax=Brassica oleracea TaxID=3712 RepID=A0A3P6ET25_BRAOL|nr:unnamed protein product [Brassica oleracea]